MSLGAHRIRRLRWRLRATSTEQAFALRRALRGLLEDQLLPALQRAFDRWGASEQLIVIPRLELCVGVDSIEVLSRELPERVEAALAAALAELEPELELEQRELEQRERERATASPGASPQPRVTRSSLSEGRRAQLWRYLESGSAPVIAHAPRLELRACADEHRVATLAWLRGRPAAAWFRWLALADPREPAELQGWLPFDAAQSSERESAATRGRPGLRAALESTLTRLLFDSSTLALQLVEHARLELAAALLEAWGRGDAADVRVLVEQARRPFARASERGAPTHAALLTAAVADSVISRQLGPDERSRRRSAQEALASLLGSPRGFPRDESAALATPVAAAGLVLLHPFLPTLLRRVGCCEGAVLPASKLPAAAALLHLLATGEDAPLEPELGLIKLLLGLRLDEPLLVGGGLLDAAAHDEAEAVLRAAIDHWGAPGKLSIAGLRSSFLRRAGLVRALSDGAGLSVEPGPFDVLLGRLPWGLTIVRYPWMPRPLFIEWTAT